VNDGVDDIALVKPDRGYYTRTCSQRLFGDRERYRSGGYYAKNLWNGGVRGDHTIYAHMEQGGIQWR
jgi:hypothetical protein